MKCTICFSDNIQQISKLSHSVTSDSKMIDKGISNVICMSCGNVFNETGARNNVDIFYSDSYKLMSTSSEAESKFYSETKGISHSDWRLNFLSNNVILPNTGTILDIGCGKGNFLFAFSQMFPTWSLNGVEVSKNAISFAKTKLPDADLREGLFTNGSFDTKFDLIVALDVFEHLEEPVIFLNTVLSNLKDDGYIFLEIPNFRLNPADLFVFDHLTHFTKETLSNLLVSNGIQIIAVEENIDRMPLLVLCKKSKNKTTIKNNYSIMKNLVQDHMKFNDSMMNIYSQTDRAHDQILVFGLGIMIWAGIQNSRIHKEKIVSLFDENEFLIGQEKAGINIRSLDDIAKFKDLPLILSISPCYIENVIVKLSKFNILPIVPQNYQYYKKYF